MLDKADTEFTEILYTAVKEQTPLEKVQRYICNRAAGVCKKKPPALPPKDQSKKQGPSKKKPPPLRLSPEAESRKRHRTALAELRAKTGTPTKPKRTPPGTPTGPNAAPPDRLIHLAVETLLEKNSRALEDRRASVVATG